MLDHTIPLNFDLLIQKLEVFILVSAESLVKICPITYKMC